MRKILLILIVVVGIFSCKKDSFITSPDARVSTTMDTLFFDTVFTSVGSVTQSFKIVNEQNQKIRLSKVKLAGGRSSAFQLNVDGVASPEVNDVVINADDSLYVFVQVNVDPDTGMLPFIIRDSVEINYNGNTRWVQLQAYGQNAVFLKDFHVSGSQTWNSPLPYVIMGALEIEQGATLNLPAGTRVYLHANAPVLVSGTLLAQGTASERIVFAGDRLDDPYKDLPASWPGIYFTAESENNVLEYATIKNAYQGIIAQDMPSSSQPKVRLSKCILDNIYDAGILGINTMLVADNCLISNCGSNIMLTLGGNYEFVHCTVVTYGSSNIDHKNPVLQVSDYFEQDGSTLITPLDATFTNCIFWGENGNVDNEIWAGRKGNLSYSIEMDHVLYKAKDIPANIQWNASLQNLPPLFDNVNTQRDIYNFHFADHPDAPAVDAGIATSFLTDLDGKQRDAMPDIGCYER